MDNRAGEMEVFVLAAELKSFSAAGRKLGLSPSAVSKLVTRIEDRLGARLLVRTTRRLELTPEGEVYLGRARRILSEIAETERIVAEGARVVPRGPLRVNASVGFGERYILPLLPKCVDEWKAAHPMAPVVAPVKKVAAVTTKAAVKATTTTMNMMMMPKCTPAPAGSAYLYVCK